MSDGFYIFINKNSKIRKRFFHTNNIYPRHNNSFDTSLKFKLYQTVETGLLGIHLNDGCGDITHIKSN